MRVINDIEWQALNTPRQDTLVDHKRALEKADSERIGYDPDWKLKLVMLREQREDEANAGKAAYAASPEGRAQRSELLRKAWAAGKFSGRKQAYLKKTWKAVERAKRLRADGLTLQQVGDALGVTPYTVMRWLGWERSAEPTNRKKVIVDGVEYPSLREAERATGVSRWMLSKRAK